MRRFRCQAAPGARSAGRTPRTPPTPRASGRFGGPKDLGRGGPKVGGNPAPDSPSLGRRRRRSVLGVDGSASVRLTSETAECHDLAAFAKERAAPTGPSAPLAGGHETRRSIRLTLL